MTDRELLELAAKAGGVFDDLVWTTHLDIGVYDRMLKVQPESWHHFRFKAYPNNQWNPLKDDGDALRLAVSLNLTIRYDSLEDGPVVQVSMPWHDEFPDYWLNEWLNKDATRATRRAITRAAAEIGKSMT